MGEPASSQDGRSTLRRLGRKTGIGAVGGVVTAAGVVMLVTPGPGLVVTALGLGILGREFPAAQRQLRSAQRQLRRLRGSRGPNNEDGTRGS